MTVDVRITVTRHNDSWLDRLLYGEWFWHVSCRGYTSQYAFARTEEKAHEKAQKAARSLKPQLSVDYTYRVD